MVVVTDIGEPNPAPTNAGSLTKARASSLLILAFSLFGAILVLAAVPDRLARRFDRVAATSSHEVLLVPTTPIIR